MLIFLMKLEMLDVLEQRVQLEPLVRLVAQAHTQHSFFRDQPVEMVLLDLLDKVVEAAAVALLFYVIHQDFLL